MKEQGAGDLGRDACAQAVGAALQERADTGDFRRRAYQFRTGFGERQAAGQHHAGDIGDAGDTLGTLLGDSGSRQSAA